MDSSGYSGLGRNLPKMFGEVNKKVRAWLPINFAIKHVEYEGRVTDY
jgi:hypothetical protein